MDESKVFKIETQRSAENKAAIALLEDTLEGAKEEQIRSVAIVAVNADGSVATGYVVGDCYFQLRGGLVELGDRMFQEAEDD